MHNFLLLFFFFQSFQWWFIEGVNEFNRDSASELQRYKLLGQAHLLKHKHLYFYIHILNKLLISHSFFFSIPLSIGNVYNIPVCLWLLDTYPYNPPICFVKPTSAMMIKTGKHIDANGKIYLPYLHEWKHVRHYRLILCTFTEIWCLLFFFFYASAQCTTGLTPSTGLERDP